MSLLIVTAKPTIMGAVRLHFFFALVAFVVVLGVSVQQKIGMRKAIGFTENKVSTDVIKKETKVFVYQDGTLEDCPRDVYTAHTNWVVAKKGRCWNLPTGEFDGDEPHCGTERDMFNWGTKMVHESSYYTMHGKTALVAFWDANPPYREAGCGLWNVVSQYSEDDLSYSDMDESLETTSKNVGTMWREVRDFPEYMKKLYVIECRELESAKDCLSKIGITDTSKDGCGYKLIPDESAQKQGFCG